MVTAFHFGILFSCANQDPGDNYNHRPKPTSEQYCPELPIDPHNPESCLPFPLDPHEHLLAPYCDFQNYAVVTAASVGKDSMSSSALFCGPWCWGTLCSRDFSRPGITQMFTDLQSLGRVLNKQPSFSLKILVFLGQQQRMS